MTDAARLNQARTFLFVPGNRPERFAKALASGADAVVLDLEDAVPGPAKADARAAIAAACAGLSASDTPVVVRVNPPTTPTGREDLAWWAQLPVTVDLMVPKVEAASELAVFRERRSEVGLLPLIESAGGYLGLAEIAASPGVLRLVLGHIDFMADTGLRCSPDERELDPLRFALAMQTRRHGLAAAVDGVTTSFDDEARLRSDTTRALNFGFGGKLCIHPRQIAPVHAAMTPNEQELNWARRVVEADAAAGGAAVQLDRRMIDLPVVLQARRTLTRARG